MMKIYRPLLAMAWSGWLGMLCAGGPTVSAQSSFPSISGNDMLPGVAQPWQLAELAPPADGVVWKIQVQEGQKVDADAILLVIDNRIAKASWAVAKVSAERQASLEVARTRVVLAEQYLQRIEQAHRRHAASGLELDEARSRLREAQASLNESLEMQREAEVRLELEKQRLDAHELRAPFAGIITRILKRPGEAATRDQHLVTIANLSRLRAELFVPISQMERLKVGSQVQLQADAPVNRTLAAKVLHVDPVLDAATGTMRVVAEIDNADLQLPAGFAVRLSAGEAHGDWISRAP